MPRLTIQLLRPISRLFYSLSLVGSLVVVEFYYEVHQFPSVGTKLSLGRENVLKKRNESPSCGRYRNSEYHFLARLFIS